MLFAKTRAVEFSDTFVVEFVGTGAVVGFDPNNCPSIAPALVFAVFTFVSCNRSDIHLKRELRFIGFFVGKGSAAAASLRAPVSFQQVSVVDPFLPASTASTLHSLVVATVTSPRPQAALGWKLLVHFFLMTDVLITALSGVVVMLAPIAFGMTAALWLMIFGTVTGASANPPRTRGLAICAVNLTEAIPCEIVQFVGTIVVVFTYRIFAKVSGNKKGNGKSHKPTFQPMRIRF